MMKRWITCLMILYKVTYRASFKKYHQFITEGKEVNRLINDMIYFVRDTIMNKTSEKDTDIEH